MKRNIFFLILFSAFVTYFFIACSNDNDILDINYDTCSPYSSPYMTREEIQTRLDEIREKYEKTIILTDETDTTKVTEEFFDWVENLYQNDEDKKTMDYGTEFIADEQIDEITIPKIGTFAAPGENICYNGSFKANCNYYGIKLIKVNITWYSSTINPDYIIASCDDYDITNLSWSIFSGPSDNPTFNYSFSINGTTYTGTYLGGGISGANLSLTFFKMQIKNILK